MPRLKARPVAPDRSHAPTPAFLSTKLGRLVCTAVWAKSCGHRVSACCLLPDAGWLIGVSAACLPPLFVAYMILLVVFRFGFEFSYWFLTKYVCCVCCKRVLLDYLLWLQLQKIAAGCWPVCRRRCVFCQLSSKLLNKFKNRVLHIFRKRNQNVYVSVCVCVCMCVCVSALAIAVHCSCAFAALKANPLSNQSHAIVNVAKISS